MEPIGSRPPRLGVLYRKVNWTLHRLDAINGELKTSDCELLDDGFIKYFPFNNINALGVSCFVPLGEPPHKTPISDQVDCYILPRDITLPRGLALVYTNKMKLRFPSETQKVWHFVITPTQRMKLEDYQDAIKHLGWELCDIKVGVELKKLVREENDLDDVPDFRITQLYWLITIWFEQTEDAWDRFLANSIHTWIAQKKPFYKELILDKQRARIVFSALTRLDVESITQKTYKYSILCDIEDRFGWEDSYFRIDPKVSKYQEGDSGFLETEKKSDME
ncbi:hypothetical protein RclHR1_03560006 [Rhizophagus clarus]|uniref:Uncharacterized protein n=1 Tax=Rhizophagus clarus TaxID=94130 RepID=A0A2Z6RSQ5_9GLOM|nr:hypothetical protein RclHR1_03560006 [Rhizophagus clarus]GET01455.1 hypothetical protein GLOIN_2v1871372 [Rhizophagus clarus]